MTKKPVLFIVALAIFVGALLACGSLPDTNTGTLATSSDKTPTTAPAKHFKKGDNVNVGNIWQITVSKVRTSTGDQYSEPSKSSNQFFIISLVMKNISDKEQDAYGSAPFSLRDPDGNQMDLSLYTGEDVQQSPSGKVEPGKQLKGDIVYEVPKGAKKFELHFENNMFESGQTIWDLSA